MIINPLTLSRNKLVQWFLIALLIIYQMIRLVTFVNTYGGLEHDSGWLLGVARSLAERGTYTTLVSTMSDPTVTAGLDMNREFFQIQDQEGRIYFFAEGTTGPSQIIPDALMLKLFGRGFWQFRMASLIYYLTFLVLASWLLFLRRGGLGAVVLFHAIFFFYPHLAVFLGYESLGEIPAVTWVLFSFVFFIKAVYTPERKNFWFWLSGWAAGLAILAKLIALLALSGLGWLGLILYRQKKITFKHGLWMGLGFLCFPLLWELIMGGVIGSKFGLDVYSHHLQQRYGVFLHAGSGVGEEIRAGADFFWYKFLLISEIAHPNQVLSLFTLALVAFGGPFLMWQRRDNPRYQHFVILIWSGWLAHTAWFVILSENGWVRHEWTALILAVLLLSLLWSDLLHSAQTQPVWLHLPLAIGVSLLLGLNFYSQRPAGTVLMSDNLVDYWHQKHLARPHTGLPWNIVPRADQEAAVTVLQQLPASARIFFPGNHKSAEMATLSGRMFYPLERRPQMPAGVDDVVIIGPSLISPWTKLMEKPMSEVERQGLINTVAQQIRQQCPQVIFENNYYLICALN